MQETHKKSPYLLDIPLTEALSRFQVALKENNLWGILSEETIPLEENAVGRVLSVPVWAKISSPNYHASAMDGYAVYSPDTSGALLTAPVSLIYGPQTIYVDTGDPLPERMDAVIPIENVEPIDEAGYASNDLRHPYAIRIRTATTPWQHVRSMGEDIVATQLILAAGHMLRPVDLGAIAACGHSQVRVSCRPRVAILPTGSELVAIGEPVEVGQIIEYNSLMLAAQVNEWGGHSKRYPIVVDDFALIQSAVLEACRENDLILLNAGSSAGSEDFTADIVASLGTLLVHGVAVRPGHPVILGIILQENRRVPIIGVPGYPVSAALTCEIFVEPLLANWLGRQPNEPTTIQAKLTRKITSPAGDDDYMRVAVGRVGEKVLAAPLSRGAGVITSLVQADGIAIIPRGIQGFPADAEITVRLYRSPSEIDRTLFIVGSHDVTIDLLAQFLARRGRRLVSSNVGSLAGLIALKRGESHFGGSHLLDPQSGVYNLKYVQHYLSGMSIVIVGFVDRQQGLIVKHGNPKRLFGIEDLIKPDVKYINRQKGAGTRVLLDHHLDLLGIPSDAIKGYGDEEYTHLAVAAAVKSGKADCGLGIAAAAIALDLEFIPLFLEEYQLIVPREYYSSNLLRPLHDILDETQFQSEVAKLPGYNTKKMGKIIAEMG